MGVSPAPSGAHGPMEGDPVANTNKYGYSIRMTTATNQISAASNTTLIFVFGSLPSSQLTPSRPAPPPPRPPNQSQKPLKQKKPR